MNIRGRKGGDDRRRRIWVSGGPRTELIAALARAIGIEVASAESDEVDLRVIEGEAPEDLPPDASTLPTMVVATRRLRDAESATLRRAGARWVLDSDASLLDAAFALSELLFRTIAEQRRYWRDLGGTPVRYRRLDRTESEGAVVADLIGLAREGGFLRTRRRPEEGTPIEVALTLPTAEARLRGRVAYVADDGFAIEFALDDQNVAPRLSALAAGARLAETARNLRLGRPESGAEL